MMIILDKEEWISNEMMRRSSSEIGNAESLPRVFLGHGSTQGAVGYNVKENGAGYAIGNGSGCGMGRGRSMLQ
jgi:hypothetical protein